MKKWEGTLVGPATTLEEAIRVLDRETLRIVLVVDPAHRLLGTLTDGDVRRALLRQQPLSTLVGEVMNRQPKVAHPDWSKARILAWMENNQLLQLPVVDGQMQLLGLETLHGLLKKPRQDNPVFLMSGGFGTRLRPLTESCPKPLLRIGGKPILELVLEGFVNAGFHRFFVSTHYLPEQIRKYFGDGSNWDVSIRYVHEDEPLGTGGALGLLPAEEIDQPLFLMNGDLLTNISYLSLLAFHEEHGGVATMCVRELEQQIPYGVIQTEGVRVTDIVEKPVHHFTVNAGIYVLSPGLVRSVRPETAIDMPELLHREIRAGHRVNIFPIKEYWLDIGRMEDFERAQSEVGELFDE